MDFTELQRQLSFYEGGGARRKKAGIGEVLAALGVAAGGVGEGMSSFAAPGLERAKREREMGKTLLELGAKSNTPLGAEQIQALMAGQVPQGFQIGGKQPTTFPVFNSETGEFDYITIGAGDGKIGKVLTKNPPNQPKPGSSQTPQQRAWLHTLELADKAVAEDNEISEKFRKQIEAAGKGLGVDVSAYIQTPGIETEVEAPEGPSPLQLALQRFASRTKAGVKSAASKAGSLLNRKQSDMVTVTDSSGKTGQIPRSRLEQAKKLDPGLKVK